MKADGLFLIKPIPLAAALSVTKWDYRFLEQAKFTSSWSKDPSTKVGACISFPDRSFTPGYNGFPANMPDSAELYANRDEKYSRIVHAEMNALLRVKQPITEGCTLYTYPFMSCDRCFVHMLQAGITRFVSPKPTQDQLTRWGPAFERVRSYAREANVELIEMEISP